MIQERKGNQLSEKKTLRKHTEKRPRRYNPEKKSKELIQNVDKICKMSGISKYTLAKGAYKSL